MGFAMDNVDCRYAAFQTWALDRKHQSVSMDLSDLSLAVDITVPVT